MGICGLYNLMYYNYILFHCKQKKRARKNKTKKSTSSSSTKSVSGNSKVPHFLLPSMSMNLTLTSLTAETKLAFHESQRQQNEYARVFRFSGT